MLHIFVHLYIYFLYFYANLHYFIFNQCLTTFYQKILGVFHGFHGSWFPIPSARPVSLQSWLDFHDLVAMAAGDTTDVVCQLGSLLPWDKFSIEEGKCFSWKERKHVEKSNVFLFTNCCQRISGKPFFKSAHVGAPKRWLYTQFLPKLLSLQNLHHVKVALLLYMVYQCTIMYIIYTLQLLDIIWRYLTYTHSSFIYVIRLSITLVKSSVHFLSLPSVNVQKHFRLNYIYLPCN